MRLLPLVHLQHFFGIWSVYATERPDVLDPAMGTESDFKALVAGFHNAGIKVFLDVVTHGVTFASGGDNATSVAVAPSGGGTASQEAMARKAKPGANPFLKEKPG